MRAQFLDPMGAGRFRKCTATLLLFSLTLALAPSIQAAPQSGDLQWQTVDGEFVKVSADSTNVWALKADDTIWRRPVDGSGTWSRVNGKMREISATGAGWVWGTNAATNIYKCAKPCPADGSGWKKVDGNGTSISADATSVWVIQPDETIRRRPVKGSGLWETVNGSLRSISAAGNGWVWGVTGANFVYKCPKPCGVDGSGWEKTPGQMQRVEADGDFVLAIALDGTILRKPITGAGPWRPITGSALSVASAGNGWIWAVNPTRMIYKAKFDGSTAVASTRPRPKPPTTRPPVTAKPPASAKPPVTKPPATTKPPKVIQGTAVVTPPKPDPKPDPPKVVQGTVTILPPKPEPPADKPNKPTVIIGDLFINPVVKPDPPKPEPPIPDPPADKPTLGGKLIISSGSSAYPASIIIEPGGTGGLANNWNPNANVMYVDEDAFCWKDNFGRVSLPQECAGGQYEVGFCYPECKEGYHRHLTICYEDCPEGFIDDLALCRRPPDTITKLSYGNTAGIPLVCPPGTVEGAGLCYPKCKEGYYGLAGICWEDSCPEGYANDPLTCRRDPVIYPRQSYGRGAGQSMTCTEGYQQIGALCYPNCKAGFNGELDWCRKPCPEGFNDDGVTCSVPPHATTADNSECPWYDKCCIAIGRNQGYKSYCPDGYRNDGCTCFRDAKIVSQEMYYRGQVPFNGCPDGTEQGGALCYPQCKEGFAGNGPVCWGGCPDDFATDPATCRKDAHIYSKKSYGRGAGQLPSACPAGYEKDPGGALCYPTCKEGYHMVGPVCWRNDRDAAAVESCPEGYRDDGLFCTRDLYVFGPKSYNTGVGSFPSCPEGQSMIGGLCYESCGAGYNEVGPVCWQNCPGTIPIDTGLACAGSDLATAQSIGKMIFAAFEVFFTAVTAGGWSAAKQAATTGAKVGVKLGTKEGIKAAAKNLAGKLGSKIKKGPQKITDNIDDVAKAAGKNSSDVTKEVLESGTDITEAGSKKIDDLTDAGKDKVKIYTEEELSKMTDAQKAEVERLSAQRMQDRLRELEDAGKANLDQKAIDSGKEKLIQAAKEGLAAAGKIKGVAQAGINAGAFVEEAVRSGDLAVEMLGYLDVTGISGLVESFMKPTCPVLPPGTVVQPPLGSGIGPTRYTGSIFGGRGESADSEFDFALSSPVEGFAARGEGGPETSSAIGAEFFVPPNLFVECGSPDGTRVPIGQAKPIAPANGVTFTNSAPDLFPLGETVVTWTSTSIAGDSSVGQQTVRVVDTTPPMILATAETITAECASTDGTSVGQPVSAVDSCDPSVELVGDAPDLLPFGSTVVNWSATDAAGNRATALQTIDIVDTTPPWLACQEQVFAYADEGAEGATVEFALTAGDLCSVVETVTCTAPSGGLFPLGVTEVACQATDGAGLTADCGFQVNVLPAPIAQRGPTEQPTER